jgi:hypothetical protein
MNPNSIIRFQPNFNDCNPIFRENRICHENWFNPIESFFSPTFCHKKIIEAPLPIATLQMRFMKSVVFFEVITMIFESVLKIIRISEIASKDCERKQNFRPGISKRHFAGGIRPDNLGCSALHDVKNERKCQTN